jgi:hypothetical protein
MGTSKKMTFIEGAKFILNEFNNMPMSSQEIWEEISKRELVETSGSTPRASLNTRLLADCVDSPVSQSRKSRDIFKKVSDRPAKFVLNNYMSDNIKKTLKDNGFLTMDMLSEIFEKNGLKLDK